MINHSREILKIYKRNWSVYIKNSGTCTDYWKLWKNCLSLASKACLKVCGLVTVFCPKYGCTILQTAIRSHGSYWFSGQEIISDITFKIVPQAVSELVQV
jgi:hypothetical protein